MNQRSSVKKLLFGTLIAAIVGVAFVAVSSQASRVGPPEIGHSLTVAEKVEARKPVASVQDDNVLSAPIDRPRLQADQQAFPGENQLLALLAKNDQASIDQAISLGLYELRSDNLWALISNYLAKADSNEAFGELPCHLAMCGAHVLTVEDQSLLAAMTTVRSRDDITYLATYCQPVAKRVPFLEFRRIRKEFDETRACISGSGDLEAETVDLMSEEQLASVIRTSRSRGARQYATMVALRRQILIEGIDWDDFHGEMDEPQLLPFSALLATKFTCDERGACAPMSPFLFMICDMYASLDCKVPSDLSQIARDSLSPRAYSWWDSARLPQKPAK